MKHYKDFNDFRDNIIQTRNQIIIPKLNITINKVQFMVNGKYDMIAEDDYLLKIYNKR